MVCNEGIAQNVSNSQVYGGIQAAQGNGNQQIQSLKTADYQDITSSAGEVTKLIGQLQSLLNSEELPESIREEVNIYLNSAKKAAQKKEPNKELVKLNLKELVDTLENSNKAIDLTKGIFSKIEPILTALARLLGIAKSFWGL